MSNEEDARLQERGVTVPSMVDTVAAVQRGEEYSCPALRAGRCSVYADRPTICRLWGATTSMPCPHGCTPPNALSRQESHELLTLAGQAGGGMAPRFFASQSPVSPAGAGAGAELAAGGDLAASGRRRPSRLRRALGRRRD